MTDSTPPETPPSPAPAGVPQLPRFISPRNDLAARLLLTQNPELLRSMLEAVIDERIESLVVVEPVIPAATVAERGVILDVRCTLADKRRVNVEVQTTTPRMLTARVLFYWAKLYSANLRRGSSFEPLTPAITILWLSAPLFPKAARFRSIFELRERETQSLFSDHLCVVTLELPHLAVDPPASAPLALWARWFAAQNASDLDALAEESPIMADARAAHLRLATDPKIQAELHAIEQLVERAGVERATDLYYARQESFAAGKDEGFSLGKREERTALARRLSDRGLGLQEIAELVGLAADDVAQLLSSTSG